MIKKIIVKNFTILMDEKLSFSPHLNIIIGENGTGKSHLLKLLYSVSSIFSQNNKKSNVLKNKSDLQKNIAEKLINIFKPDTLGRLATRLPHRTRSEIEIKFSKNNDIKFRFSTKSTSEVTVEKVPLEILNSSPLFIPTRELLSVFPNFTSLYRDYEMSFDETYYDLCLALEKPLLKGTRFNAIQDLLNPLEEILDGKVTVKNGRFYVGSTEINLLAEGLRKIAMLAYLITNGSIHKKGALFWDEPETNLNNKLIKAVAKTLLELSKQKIQVFVATHSLFLMKEIDILLKKEENNKILVSYFSFIKNKDTSIDKKILIEKGQKFSEIHTVISLEESLSQSDRYYESL